MPNYRVGVSLNLRGNYGAGLTGASRQTDRFRGTLQRTAAGATSAMRRTAAAAAGVGDALGRTARGGAAALRGVAGAARNTSGVLNRTAEATRRVGTASRRMADTAGYALDRARSKVNRLIGRFGVLERTGRTAGAGLGSGLGRLAGYAGGGFAVARGAQTAASMDTLVRRLSRESDRPMEELTGLRDRAYEIGAGRGVHASELMQAVVAAQAAGGVRIESEDLESLAVIMQRAGVGGAEAGNVWARIDTLPGETRENVATLAMQADAGELQFREVIGQITRMVASVRSWATDETAVAQMGAMMNVARAGSGSVDEASAAMDTLTREAVMRAEKIREVFGVDVLSAAPGRQGFLREDFFSGAIMEIADSARAWGGEARLLEAFGADALRALKALLTQEGRDKGQESLAIRGEWSGFQADADVVAEGIEARGIAMMQKLEGALTRTITGPMQGAFSLMQAYQTELMVGGAGLLAAFNLLSRLRLNRTLTQGARTQTVATSTVATMRVGTLIVGSMPGGGGRPGRPGPGAPGGAVLGPDGRPAKQQPRGGGTANQAAGRPGRAAGWFRALRGGRGIPYAGTAIAGLTLLPAVASGDTRSVVQSTAGLAGGWGGALAGMKAGALLGAFAGPVGAAIGSAIGGVIGGGAGWWGAGRLADELLDGELNERDRPRRSVRGRVRQGDLAARTAGVPIGVDIEDPGDVELDPRLDPDQPRPRRSVRGRVRQGDLAAPPELPVAPRSVTYDHSDHSDRSIHIAPGAITVQAADDPEATAETVADRVMEITERERRRRDRRTRNTILEDPEPDPEF